MTEGLNLDRLKHGPQPSKWAATWEISAGLTSEPIGAGQLLDPQNWIVEY